MFLQRPKAKYTHNRPTAVLPNNIYYRTYIAELKWPARDTVIVSRYDTSLPTLTKRKIPIHLAAFIAEGSS